MDFAKQIIKKYLKWRPVDMKIWIARFFYDYSPVRLAEHLGCKRSYIDTRFSQLKEMFNRAIRQWWSQNVEMVPVRVKP